MPTLQPETPELAAEDPEAPPVQATEAEENSTNQHTPENSVVLTPEEIRAALDAGAMDAAEAQCIDLSDENGFFSWLFNFLFGWLGKKDESQPEPVYSGWRTSGGKTYYYSQSTNKPVTGIQCIDNKLYYFNADGVLEKGKTFGVDVSKYQKMWTGRRSKRRASALSSSASATAAMVRPVRWCWTPCSRSISPM